ncbi:MAG: hypothetical protein AAGA69_02480, partial [Pseudomonadota bacterium]
ALWFLHRRVRPFHSVRARKRFEDQFASRWSGVSSSHDEAVGLLKRVATVRPKLFEPNLLTGLVRGILMTLFLAFTTINLFSEMNNSLEDAESWLENVPVIGPGYLLFDTLLEDIFEYIPSISVLDRFELIPSEVMEILQIIFATVCVNILFILSIFILLNAGDFITRLTFGRWLAGMLNASAQRTVIDKAYGNTAMGERSLDASTSPFGHFPGAEPMPEPANTELIAYAHEHAAGTVATLHQTLFGADPEGEIEIEKFMGQITWRELVHTAYFKVAGSRAHLVRLSVG